MALRSMPLTEMITVTRTWVDRDHEDHRVLAARPLTAPLLPELDRLHSDALRAQPVSEAVQRLGEIQNEQGGVDLRHDDLLRAIDGRLESEILLADDQAELERLHEVRQLILPDGLRMINASYREEVGHAERVARTITTENKATLSRMGTLRGTLYDTVVEWLSTADALGQLDHERRGVAFEATGLGSSEVTRIRMRWIRMIELLRRMAALLGDDVELSMLLGRVDVAEADADRRVANRAGHGAGEDLPAGESDGEGAGNTSSAGDTLDGDNGEPAAADASDAGLVDLAASQAGAAFASGAASGDASAVTADAS